MSGQPSCSHELSDSEMAVSDTSSEGYDLEPQYTDEQFEMLQAEVDHDARERAGHRTREGNWCQCGNCKVSPDMWVAECVCCRDDNDPDVGEQVRSLLKEAPPSQPIDLGVPVLRYQCVTNHHAFWALCLYKRNLMNAARRHRADYGQASLRFRNENRLLRYVAYREFIRWTFGYLGKHIRKVIPACVVNTIRNAFPKNNQETYEGFHYADDFDPDLERMFL